MKAGLFREGVMSSPYDAFSERLFFVMRPSPWLPHSWLDIGNADFAACCSTLRRSMPRWWPRPRRRTGPAERITTPLGLRTSSRRRVCEIHNCLRKPLAHSRLRPRYGPGQFHIGLPQQPDDLFRRHALSGYPDLLQEAKSLRKPRSCSGAQVTQRRCNQWG